jgi:general secretion pathway protein K
VNVNTAARETLVAAVEGLDLGGAERIVQARQRKPIRDLAELQALTPGLTFDPTRVSVNSSHFRVAGRLRLEDRVLEERSLLVRRDNRVEVLRREKRSFAASSR